MAATEQGRFGKLPPKYKFTLNPYPDERLTKCPICDERTGQRKQPLLIHIEPQQPIALNYTCRYCKTCDLLIAHKHEIEHLLTMMMLQRAPHLIGNDYFIFGTIEEKAWRKGMQEQKGIDEMRAFISDFAEHYGELSVTEGGWFGPGQEPGIRKPPPSTEWVKRGHKGRR